MVVETGYYDLLGVSPTATAAEIRRGYRKTALAVHPDRAGDSADATAAFQKLQQAYSSLYDAESRVLYDQFGAAGVEDGGGANSAFARANAGPRLSKEDIAEFEKTYRYSDIEREDLHMFFDRFDGDVRKVLHYIPYSEEADLERFVLAFDVYLAQKKVNILENDAPNHEGLWPLYNAAKKKLMKKAAKTPQRKQGDAVEAADEEDGEGDTVAANGRKGRKKKAAGKPKKKSKEQKDADSLSALIVGIRGRGNQWGQFVAGLEDKYSKPGTEDAVYSDGDGSPDWSQAEEATDEESEDESDDYDEMEEVIKKPARKGAQKGKGAKKGKATKKRRRAAAEESEDEADGDKEEEPKVETVKKNNRKSPKRRRRAAAAPKEAATKAAAPKATKRGKRGKR